MCSLSGPTLYAADEISGQENWSEAKEEEQVAPPRTWEQCEMNDENEYAASTTEGAIKRPTRPRAATPSSDGSSRRSLESILESEKDFGNREDRESFVDAHLVPSVLSFSKSGAPKQPEEAPFAETEHPKHPQHPQESEGDGPIPSAVTGKHAARAAQGTRGTRKSAVDATSHGEASEQEHQQDKKLVASKHGVSITETACAAVNKETAPKHKTGIGEIPAEGERRDRHASSASSHHHREHRHHHHHHHKDHKVRSTMCGSDHYAQACCGFVNFANDRTCSSVIPHRQYKLYTRVLHLLRTGKVPEDTPGMRRSVRHKKYAYIMYWEKRYGRMLSISCLLKHPGHLVVANLD